MANKDSNKQGKQLPKTLIVGLGKTGLSCARFLKLKNLGFAIADNRLDPPGINQLLEEIPHISVQTGAFNGDAFADASQLIVSPGISIKQPVFAKAQSNGVEILGDIELFARNVNAPVVAVTGSNGKSTVTCLLGEMAQAANMQVKVGGNLGTPALDLLRDSLIECAQDKTKIPDFYLLELSSFQLETTQTLNAFVAVVLNVSPDHMDRYDDFVDYAQTKQRVYQGDGTLVVNRDDSTVLAMEKALLKLNPNRAVLRFTMQKPNEGEYGVVSYNGEDWLAFGESRLLDVSELLMPGRHNQANALAALAIGNVMGIPMQSMLEVLRGFTGLAHRTQWVAEIDQVNWYNDSKGTNVGATVAAIEGMPGEMVLIVGGEGKGADFSPLADAIENHMVKATVLFGKDAKLIQSVLSNSTTVRLADSLTEAVSYAKQLAQPGDSVLFSPACASFDMFENFVQRGEAFEAEVGKLSA